METPLDERAISLEKTLPALVGGKTIQASLLDKFGKKKADLMLSMMSIGKFTGDAGNELHDYISDAVVNDSIVVWSGLIQCEEHHFPVQIKRYSDIYYVWAIEYDDVGYFLSLDTAKSYVLDNWDEVVEDR